MKKLDRITLFFCFFIIIAFSYLNRNYFFDDTMIYARYIKNSLSGDGLVYNIGEKFNGLTSPLYSYISIIIISFTKNIILTLNILSCIFLIATLLIFNKVLKNIIKPSFLVHLSFLFLATNTILYLCFGMETFLFSFLLGICIYLFIKNNYSILFIFLALLILTRSEGIFLIITLIIEHFILKRKFPNWKVFIIPAIIIFSHYSFNYFYFGKIFPDSANAKLLHGKSNLWYNSSGINFIRLGISFFWVNIYVAWFMFLISLLGILKLQNNSINRILLIFFITLLGFYYFLNIPTYHWYYIPFYIIISIYFASGLAFIYELIAKKSIYLSILVTLFLSLIPIASNLKNNLFIEKLINNKSIIDEKANDYKKIGIWLSKNTPKNSSVGLVEIGIIGYYSDRYVVDFCGLVSNYNAKYISKGDIFSWILTYKPDYVLTHNPIWQHEIVVNQDFFKKNYVCIEDFPIKNYILFKRKSSNWLN